MQNPDRPIPQENTEGTFFTVSDGTKIFVYEYVPEGGFKKTIFIISGITGINHNSEKDIIELISNTENRIVVIHPRGTGYSEGKRGDISNISDLISDYIEIIESEKYSRDNSAINVLYGHSMSCAISLKIASKLKKIGSLILVNPPYKLKQAKGMTPVAVDYLRYIGYYVFAPHVPVVNMAGYPSVIENETDRKESEVRNNDPLLVKYFSMHYMTESKKIMNAMVKDAQQADCPLLLLYGNNDMIVDKAGCDDIFRAWKNRDKTYEIINGGSHGKSTALKGAGIIINWIQRI
jgi:alpha-beta hydrolase superfamily lysophospholipase